MSTVMQAAYLLAAVVVLAEGLNKIQRTDVFDGARGWWPRVRGLAFLFAPWRWSRVRVVQMLKLAGWALLCVGAAGAMVSPFIGRRPDLEHVAVLAGFAVLVVRSRVKEG